jgi:uncharacterized protein (TIGR02145 family)
MIVPVEGVDLGLSITWASWNLGAISKTKKDSVTFIGELGQYGEYYAWGETSSKETYTNANYTYTENVNKLPADHDAAAQNWGDGWRMPTEAEWNELVESCTIQWETVNGIQGQRYTSRRNGKSIFLPAAGVKKSSVSFLGSYGYYWSNTKNPIHDTEGSCMVFSRDGQYNDPSQSYTRFTGLQIRPVKKKE